MQAIGFLPQLADPLPHRYVLNVQLLFPQKPRDGYSAIADQGFPPFCSIAFEEIQMAFVNEVVSDEDIVKYNLPFKPGAGRYWTRDRERDCYLWGGIVENFAFGYDPEGQFDFYCADILLRVSLNMGQGSSSFKESPYRIIWSEISHIQPCDLGGLSLHDVVPLLKSALVTFGYDGRKNIFAPSRIVSFGF